MSPATPISKHNQVQQNPSGTPQRGIDRTPSALNTPRERGNAVNSNVARSKEERILVTVRVRPLSSKEIAQRDQAAWECRNGSSIVFKNGPGDRSGSSVYNFDKVFGPGCPTDRVYEEGAKYVALSSLSGINATIFAYGQTSSGKTFTMKGIIDHAVNDIYKYMAENPDRDFVIKFSALEIYNEIVKDLLNPEGYNLRLLDDPEKGVIVEKLQEETVKDSAHLRQLISICEAQRQVGETALNDKSSRSHQIIRLTIESILRQAEDAVETFFASLNFVDLAGSERASQAHTNQEGGSGARFKEGCHINRSLLTLSSVIRKLSSGGKRKNEHIPYRDSKLTRILQSSLGGNARTAIICTMSPALTHVEQSKNTLTFAINAKEVTNTAEVNKIRSEKEMVNMLQKEVARLEAELRTPETITSEVLLKEKEEKIRKMEAEMQELKQQLELTQNRLNEYERKEEFECKSPLIPQQCESPRALSKQNSGEFPGKELGTNAERVENDEPKTIAKSRNTLARQSVRQSTTAVMLVHEIRKLEKLQDELGHDASRAMEVLEKELACLRLAQSGLNRDATEKIEKLQAEIKDLHAQRASVSIKPAEPQRRILRASTSDLKEEFNRLQSNRTGADSAIANLEEQLENAQKSIANLVMLPPGGHLDEAATPSPARSKTVPRKKKSLPLSLTGTARQHLVRSPCSPMSSSRRCLQFDNENSQPNIVATPTKSEDAGGVSSKEGTPAHRRNSSVDVRKMQNMFKTAAEENIQSIRTYVTELKERVAKLQYQKQLLVCQVLELESNENNDQLDETAEEEEGMFPYDTSITESPAEKMIFLEQQRDRIIELWHLCHVSMVHRTQFYLLFKGEPADEIYFEVELRRLTWLQEHLADPKNAYDEHTVSLASNMRALKRERELYARRMRIRFSPEEREALFTKWEVPIDSKQRKLQLAQKIWTNTSRLHVQESAEIVARLVGFCEPEHVSKEMFELNFAQPADQKPWLFGWNPIAKFLDM